MKSYLLLIVLIFAMIQSSCSGGNKSPVIPSNDTDVNAPISGGELVITNASDVLYTDASRATAYKAFGIYQVVLDPKSLTAEITPSRKSQSIGMTFDSDLTQFLTVSPCTDCLGIYGIRLIPPDQVEIGFAVKHPFADITKRPDLHGFDVRGIVLAKGNWNFPLTQVALDATTNAAARANVTLVANPDGYTHHFDELASDPNYFDPPRNYDANINPFRRYFTNGNITTFDPNNPSGYNVMKVGANWEIQEYIFNIGSSPDPIDFGFIVDCSYGQSATFQNRTSPYYFLPEFNRKEAWKIDVEQVAGKLQSGDTGSSVTYKAEVCDWQAGLSADPNYPDIANLGGIKAKSDVALLSIEIPVVSGLVENTTPISGTGTSADPYIFNLTAENTQGATAGWYYGIIAVRDDLQGQQGPIAIPETPDGFPYPGPEIYDYSTYSICKVRVYGSPPTFGPLFNYPSNPKEGELVPFGITVIEPDGDDVSCLWEQISPASPVGFFEDATVEDAMWHAPALFDVPTSGVEFIIKVTASDVDGQNSSLCYLIVHEINSAPLCNGIITDPFFGVIQETENIDIWADALDPDGDLITMEWDLDWMGDPWGFDVDASGQYVMGHSWSDQGFYNVGLRLTEQRTHPLESFYSRILAQEGIINNSFKIDDSPDADPHFFQPDVCVVKDVGCQTFHYAWIDVDDKLVYYCGEMGNLPGLYNHQVVNTPPSSGNVSYANIAGSGPIIHVVWQESDTSVVPTAYRIKINSSLDGGVSFGALGGERVILEIDSPDYLSGLSIDNGTNIGDFYILFTLEQSSNYQCGVKISNDGGLTWQDAGGGYLRDVISSQYTQDASIKVSVNGVIHVLWGDARSGSKAYYYDWSDDNGDTWNTDIQVNTSSNPWHGAIAVDDYDNAYFSWTDQDGQLYFIRTVYGPPPVMGSPRGIYNLGLPAFNGTDIWVSPSGKTVISPVMYSISGHKEIKYMYSFDGGASFGKYYQRTFDPSVDADDIVCDVIWEEQPNRAQICGVWVDSRTSLIPLNDHIWGEFAYLVERWL